MIRIDPNDPTTIDLVHVLFPEEYLCVPERVLSAAHDALVDAAVDDYVKANGEISGDADGDIIYRHIADMTPRPATLEEAKAILEDTGRMTFAAVRS